VFYLLIDYKGDEAPLEDKFTVMCPSTTPRNWFVFPFLFPISGWLWSRFRYMHVADRSLFVLLATSQLPGLDPRALLAEMNSEPMSQKHDRTAICLIRCGL